MTEIENLKRELAEAKAEIQSLHLRLDNVTLLLKMEMSDSGKHPKVMIINGDLISRVAPSTRSP